MKKLLLAIFGSLIFAIPAFAACQTIPVGIYDAVGSPVPFRAVLYDAAGNEFSTSYTDSNGYAYVDVPLGQTRLVPKHPDANFPAYGRWHAYDQYQQEWVETPITSEGFLIDIGVCDGGESPFPIVVGYIPHLCSITITGNLSEFSNLGQDTNNSDGLLALRATTFDVEGNMRQRDNVYVDANGNFTAESQPGTCGTLRLRPVYTGTHSGSWAVGSQGYEVWTYGLQSNFLDFFFHSDTH